MFHSCKSVFDVYGFSLVIFVSPSHDKHQEEADNPKVMRVQSCNDT